MKKIRWIVSGISSLLIVTVVSILLFYAVKPEKVDASGGYTITVEKTTSGTIYLTGAGVSLKEQTSTTDLYEVEEYSSIVLTVVNETKIFTKWNIIDTANNILYDDTNNKLTISSVSEDMIIQAIYRDPTSSDYGKLMGNRFVISSALELIAIQNILNYGNKTPTAAIIKHYDSLFKSNILYSASDDKATYIVNNNLFNLVQNGYYLVEHNIVVFETDFVGIGTASNPFNGVICGYNNNQTSQIVVLISSVEKNNDQAFGLFSYLGDNAVVRNLKVNASIAVTKSSSTTSYGTKYVGGLAGYVNGALLYNLNVSSNITVNSKNGVIYAGNIVGSLNNVGLSDINKIATTLTKSSLVVESSGNIASGMVCGTATNAYFKNLDFDISSYNLSSRYTSSSFAAAKTNNIGLLLGQIASETTIDNIVFRANSSYNVQGYTSSGNMAIGGLIGKIDSTSATVRIGRVKFINMSADTSSIKGITVNASSTANVYTGGLIGIIIGENTVALSSFKQGVQKVLVETAITYDYDPIFTGYFSIESVQNGLADEKSTYGKCVTSGIVAKGYFDISGSSTENSDIVVIKDGKLLIKTVQSNIACHESYVTAASAGVSSDIEHAVTALFTGIVKETNLVKTFKNINMYAENVDMSVVREMSSRSMGDISIGSFVAHSLGLSYDTINMYLNHAKINCDSLSYIVKNTNGDTNNSYVGGMFGCLGNTSTYVNASIKNCSLDGYDWETGERSGNTLGISSIQNTQPGGGDYMGENYLGGMIGQLYTMNVDNCSYIGSPTDEDFIDMRAHEDPDSAFCGGLIGFIKGKKGGYNNAITINNCKVLNAFVYGEETVNTTYTNPDMYVAGLVGASYVHDVSSMSVTYNNNHVENTKIIGIGYENTEIFASGMIGAVTWSNTQNLINNSVYNCTISSSVSRITSTTGSKCGAYATGILAHNTSTTSNVNQNTVIDTVIYASAPVKSNVSGIMYNYNGATFYSSDNYSNAKMNAYLNGAQGSLYGICNSMSTNTSNYYDKNNAGGTTSGEPIDTITNVTVTRAGVNILNAIGASSTSAFHLELKDIKANFKIDDTDSSVIKYIGNATENHSAEVEVWINASNNVPPFDNTLSEEELHNQGWYRFAIININNGKLSPSQTAYIENPQFSYVKNDGEYIFNGVNFENIFYPYNKIDDLNYIERVDGTNYISEIKLFAGIAKLKFSFEVDKTTPNLFLKFFDQDGNELSAPNDKLLDLGKYDLVKTVIDDKIKYEYTFTPNVELNKDTKLIAKFLIGSSTIYDDVTVELNFIHNKYNLVGVTTADYTRPINYHTEDASRYIDPIYYLEPSVTTKFIPVYKMSNDPTGSYVVDEINTNRVTYALNRTAGGTMKSSGELVTGYTTSITTTYTVTLTDKLSQTKVALTYYIVDRINISYNIDGGEFDGALVVANTTSYRFAISTHNGYGGRFKEFTIEHGSNKYNLLNAANFEYLKGLGIKIVDNFGNIINTCDDYLIEATSYEISIPDSLIQNDTIITASFPRVYEITFNMQATFIDNYDDDQRVFVVEEGTNFHDYFFNYKKEIDEWIEKTCIFGYVFSDFFLVDDANTIVSYGESFQNIYEMLDFAVNSSINFYGRWSFLIELIEAPGTHIKSSFADSFMQDYSEELLVNRTIQIPINKNKGYVFTVTKDDNYVGESSVKAYTVVEKGDEKIISDIKIEKYFENMYLYFIPPEAIKGYLVIETSVSNSGFIVGENTATISDEIIPEDGVFTYKYVVNHRNVGDVKSYIYNSGAADSSSNLKLNKDILIRFSKQLFDETTKKTVLVDAGVPFGSTIKVYYQKITNGTVTKKIVAAYNVNTSDKKRILLSEFTLLDSDTSPAFPSETFASFLGNAETVSEVYYIVITPPNGLSMLDNEIHNYYMEVGYYNPNEADEFVRGIRNQSDLANKPLEDLMIDESLKYESSKNTEFFSITPSRKTSVVRNENGTYTFRDYNKYDILELIVKNGLIDEATKEIHMYDSNLKNTVLDSKKLSFEINNLKIRMGYGKGTVNVYGSIDGVTYDLIKVITLDSIKYQDYEVPEFANGSYQYFRIDNSSLTEIRMSAISVMSKTNGIVYEFKEFKTNDKGDTLNVDLSKKITNDSRHEGCHFFIGIQIKANGEIVKNIENVTLITNVGNSAITVNPISADVKGKNVVYFDLTAVMLQLQLENSLLSEFNFRISLGTTNYEISAIELLEVFNINKPALAEVRQLIVQ